MLEEYLEEKELEDKRRKAEEPNSANPIAGKGKDAKKDPKAAAAKGKAPAATEDKNAPQPITVEYPEEKATKDVDFLVYERQFDATFGDDAETVAKMQKLGAPPSTLDLLGNGDKKNPYGVFGEKYKEKGKQLIQKYKIIRGSKYSLTLKIRLNMPEEVIAAPVEDVNASAIPEPEVDKKKKKK